MERTELAELLFPHIDRLPKDYEKIYPARMLPKGAKVTRLGPSPTGFIHLGNLYVALANERLAHQSEGLFFLRIEDTDEKREIKGAVETLISSLDYFGIHFDEGADIHNETGSYGPYYQSKRAQIYQCFVKDLISKGLAYPCFCTEEDLVKNRTQQELSRENPGYYGTWAHCRGLTLDEIKSRLSTGKSFVIRFRAHGDPEKSFDINDGIRGKLTMPENYQDIIILKRNGIPTYHFAHVVDDHLMRTTHVVRGEEWLSSLPVHVALFDALNWSLPVYCHTTVLMKMDGNIKRKLSKRNDPELSLNYYRAQGYHPLAIREYLMTVLNSDYEEWRLANPDEPLEKFAFSTDTMSSSGTLFDLYKLNDISKEVMSRLSDEEIYDFLLTWVSQYRKDLLALFREQRTPLLRILAMDRHGDKPRKDLAYGIQIFDHISYFFDDHFRIRDEYPDSVNENDLIPILQGYLNIYDHEDDRTTWFERIRKLAVSLGYAAKPRDYKKNPESFKGHVGDVSTVIRIALMGRSSSPDLWEIQSIIGKDRTIKRLKDAVEKLLGSDR